MNQCPVAIHVIIFTVISHYVANVFMLLKNVVQQLSCDQNIVTTQQLHRHIFSSL